MSQSELNHLTQPVADLITRAPVEISPDASIEAAALQMKAHDVSCLLLTTDGELTGIVTDRDLRNRAVAKGHPTDAQIKTIATLTPQSIEATATVFEGLVTMTRNHIHHLPILRHGKPIGVITATSIMQTQNTSPVALANSIRRQHDLDGLVAATANTATLQQSLANADASAYSVGHIMTAITDATTNQLLAMAHRQLGPPPVPYAWVAAGSQGRLEQTAKTDQDNCLILDDSFEEATHGAYFKALTTFVCDGLNACGYVYCPGNMMAVNPQWRVTLSQWQKYFERWITQPDPNALMLTCVFFDLRFIGGTASLFQSLQEAVFPLAQKNGIFLSHMVANALTHRPALNWWGGLSWNQAKRHPKSINLKHNAIVPIVDLARVYALAEGIPSSNTYDRLLAADHNVAVSRASAHDLRDTLAYLGKLRIQHQAAQTKRGETADNYLRLNSLSNFENIRIHHAFKTIKQLQEALAHRYQASRLT